MPTMVHILFNQFYQPSTYANRRGGMVQADGAIYKTNFNFAPPARTFHQRGKVHQIQRPHETPLMMADCDQLPTGRHLLLIRNYKSGFSLGKLPVKPRPLRSTPRHLHAQGSMSEKKTQ